MGQLIVAIEKTMRDLGLALFASEEVERDEGVAGDEGVSLGQKEGAFPGGVAGQV